LAGGDRREGFARDLMTVSCGAGAHARLAWSDEPARSKGNPAWNGILPGMPGVTAETSGIFA